MYKHNRKIIITGFLWVDSKIGFFAIRRPFIVIVHFLLLPEPFCNQAIVHSERSYVQINLEREINSIDSPPSAPDDWKSVIDQCSRSLISNPEDNPAKEVHKTNKTKSFMVISCRPIMVLNWSLNLWPFYPKIDRRNEHIASKIQVYKVSLIVILLHDISHLGKLSKCNEEKNLPRLQTLDSIWQSSRWDEFIFRKFFAKHNNRKIVFVKTICL